MYLYCIRNKSNLTVSATGFAEQEKVFSLNYRQIEAVVCKVSLEEFASEEIQKKAGNDIEWIKEKAVIHEKVIEHVMIEKNSIVSVIPMRFGTVFNNMAGLKNMLKKNYDRFCRILNEIREKQEWSVKIYLTDRKKFEDIVKENEPTIKKKEKIINSMSEGMAFFMEGELKEEIERFILKELDTNTMKIYKKLDTYAVKSVINKILHAELTGRSEPMVLNAAYLISEMCIEDFINTVDEQNILVRENGLSIEYSGPWPAFNFTSPAS